MDDLIRRSDVFDNINKRRYYFGKTALDEAYKAVYKAPTIEAEPVRHGRWILVEGDWVCNKCGTSPADWESKPDNPLGLPPFCHSCGLKMHTKEE